LGSCHSKSDELNARQFLCYQYNIFNAVDTLDIFPDTKIYMPRRELKNVLRPAAAGVVVIKMMLFFFPFLFRYCGAQERERARTRAKSSSQHRA
jgi:hypothetical protein